MFRILTSFFVGAAVVVGMAWSVAAGSRTVAGADFSGNGRVDFTDFILFASAFGSAAPRFDLDGSGHVDFGDFIYFASVYGQEVEPLRGAAIKGALRDIFDRGLYGALVRTASDSVRTGRDGTFEVPADSSGKTALKIEAPGYVGQAIEVEAAGDTTLGAVSLQSQNRGRLLSAAAAARGDSAGVAAAIRELGFLINDDPATNQGFAGSHVNGLARLQQAEKQVSLGEIAEELALLGVTFNGVAIAGEDMVDVLQALLDAALMNPEDPRGFMMLQVFSNPDGSLPETPPALAEETLLSPTKAMALLAAVRLAAEHSAEVPAGTVFPSEGDLKTRVARSWQEVPLGGGRLEAAAAPAVDPAEGGLLGMRLGWDQAGDLGIEVKEEPRLPYYVGGQVVQREGLGGALANEIFKLMTNSVGEAVAAEEIAGAFLAPGGEIETPSGAILPERDYRIVSGERTPNFKGLAGYGISSRFRVDCRDAPGGIAAYAIGSRFKLDTREIVSNRHSADSQPFGLDTR